MYESVDSINYGPRIGPEWNAVNLNIISGDSNREGAYELGDEAEKIMGVVEQISAKEWVSFRPILPSIYSFQKYS